MKVVHLIAEFSAREAMGRTVVETAARVDAEHHLVTTRAHDSTAAFATAHELGGGIGSFPWRRRAEVARVLDLLKPDLVHLHAGALGPIQATLPVLRGNRMVLTVYAWPSVPGPRTWRRAGFRQMRASNVLQPRVAATTLLPPLLARGALRRAGVGAVLTPDPRVARRLARQRAVPVVRLTAGAPCDPRRARYDADNPVIVFAGRAETVRGLDTLVAAFPLVRMHFPTARLRLLLIPRPELDSILSTAGGDGIEVVTEPVGDLLDEFARAQVGVWPFKFDYTTSPPAMAVAEAMSVGLPVVATNVACVRAVLEPGVNGLAVAPANPSALAGSIGALLRHRETWQRYADAGVRSVAEQFGWDKVADATAGAYASVLQR